MTLEKPPDDPKEGSEDPSLTSRRAFFFGTALTVATAFVGVAVNSLKDDDDEAKDAAQSTPDADPEFNPQNYHAPKEFGRVLERKLYPESKKTVIVLVDFHPEAERSSPEVLHQSYMCQAQSYRILDDLRRQLGHLPVVCENWSDDVDFVEAMRGKSKDDPLFSRPGYSLLYELFHEADEEKRRQLVEENLGKVSTPSPILLASLYQQEVKLLGAGTLYDLQRFLVLNERFESLSGVLYSPESFACDTPGNPSFSQAQQDFARGKATPEVVDCYCWVRENLQQAINGLFENRHKEAPELEIGSAMNEASPVVAVFTGAFHLPEQRKILQEMRANYIVVSPNALASSFPANLDEYVIPEDRAYELPDDASGTCGKWKEDYDKRSAEELIRWMNEGEE